MRGRGRGQSLCRLCTPLVTRDNDKMMVMDVNTQTKDSTRTFGKKCHDCYLLISRLKSSPASTQCITCHAKSSFLFHCHSISYYFYGKTLSIFESLLVNTKRIKNADRKRQVGTPLVPKMKIGQRLQ